MESTDGAYKPEPFDLGGKEPRLGSIPSRTWRFLRNKHKQGEKSAQATQKMLIQDAEVSGKSAKSMAGALGGVAFKMYKMLMDNEQSVQQEKLQHLYKFVMSQLKEHKIDVINPIHKPLEGDFLDYCVVLKNLPQPDVQSHIVGEVISPLVLLDGKLARSAEVIGWIPEMKEEPPKSES